MKFRRRAAFQPAVEHAEARILATAAPHALPVAAESVEASQAWVKIVNRTGHALTFELSANGGETFHTYRLGARSQAAYHADHASPIILLRTASIPVTALAASPTRREAVAYSIRADATVAPGPDLSGVTFGGVGGSGGAATNVARFTILNQTSSPNQGGGVPVVIQFSVDGGRTFPAQDTVPYTGGLKPRPETIYYGNQGIRYRLPANPAIGVQPLTSLNSYTLFSNTSFQPYLFPTN